MAKGEERGHAADYRGAGRGPQGLATAAGTFTAGRVGPEALPRLPELARTSAQFALSTNRRVWTGQGFDRALDRLAAAGRIAGLRLIEVEIYGAAAARIDADHAADRAPIALLRAV